MAGRIEPLLRQGAAHFQLTLSEAQLAVFDQYSRTLIAWNQKFNLTRITDPEEIVVKHFLDSLSVYEGWPEQKAEATMIDVGSGAGFPGLPLKLGLPKINVTLLESTAKKCRFLEEVVAILAIPEVTILNHRAEIAGQLPTHRAKYDIAVARAVARLSVLVEYLLPFVKIGGRVIAQKGQVSAEEIDQARRAIRQLGGTLKEIRPVTVPELKAERHLVIIDKVRPTPKLYPRRPGLPAKEPL